MIKGKRLIFIFYFFIRILWNLFSSSSYGSSILRQKPTIGSMNLLTRNFQQQRPSFTGNSYGSVQDQPAVPMRPTISESNYGSTQDQSTFQDQRVLASPSQLTSAFRTPTSSVDVNQETQQYGQQQQQRPLVQDQPAVPMRPTLSGSNYGSTQDQSTFQDQRVLASPSRLTSAFRAPIPSVDVNKQTQQYGQQQQFRPSSRVLQPEPSRNLNTQSASTAYRR